MRQLLILPDVIEGAGAYVDEIIESLNYWVNNPEHPKQEHEFLTDLHHFTGTYLERDRLK